MARPGDPTASVLRRSPLFAGCSEEELRRLVERSGEIRLASGEALPSDDEPAEEVWILLEGELLIGKRVNGQEVVSDHVLPGALLGEIPFLTRTRPVQHARAKGDCRLLRIPGEAFQDLLQACASTGESMLRALAERVRKLEHLARLREPMAELGTLAAGLAHELKNPAFAAKRAAAALEQEVEGLRPLARRLAGRTWTSEQLELLDVLHDLACEAGGAAGAPDPVEREDRVGALAGWLEKRGVGAAWELAPCLVDGGLDEARLEAVAAGIPAEVLGEALDWAVRKASAGALLREVVESTRRIFELARAVKAYSHLDSTSLSPVDVREGLENALVILGHKIKGAGVRVERDFGTDLPQVPAYGTELHQVWLNLIDNAIDALGAKGTIRLSTRRDGEEVIVEVADAGPGIPPEVLPRIFEPFFTTKPAGQGTGLGLEMVERIVNRHGGRVRVTSRPGDTRFEVRLPLTGAPCGEAEAGATCSADTATEAPR